MGSDTTTSAVEHRFRPLRKQAMVVRQAVASGKDALDVSSVLGMNEKGTVAYFSWPAQLAVICDLFYLNFSVDDCTIFNSWHHWRSNADIAKYFGASTPAGLQWQFRDVKKQAQTLRTKVDSGKPPASLDSGGAGRLSPSAGLFTPQTNTRKRNAFQTPTATGRGRKTKRVKVEADSDMDIDEIEDYEELEYEMSPLWKLWLLLTFEKASRRPNPELGRMWPWPQWVIPVVVLVQDCARFGLRRFIATSRRPHLLGTPARDYLKCPLLQLPSTVTCPWVLPLLEAILQTRRHPACLYLVPHRLRHLHLWPGLTIRLLMSHLPGLRQMLRRKLKKLPCWTWPRLLQATKRRLLDEWASCLT